MARTQASEADDRPDAAALLGGAETLGRGLRRAREAAGVSLAQLTVQTRVPVRYLTALEQDDFSILPPRVFATGYVRSYALALGLDEHLALERFKRESPDPSVPLQAPAGIAFQDVRRSSPWLAGAAAVLVVAIIGWNVFQRVSLSRAPQPSDIAAIPEAWREETPLGAGNPLTLAPPRAAPADQTVPKLYVTPGLEAQLTGIDPTSPEALAAAAAQPPVQAAFDPAGALYGAPANASQVVIQARESANLVVSLADRRVLFARQLAEGDAWRAPLGLTATIDVSEPQAFDVFMNGEYAGRLETTLTPLARLNTEAQRRAQAVAARAEAARLVAVEREAAAQAARAPAPAITASTPRPPATN